MDGKQRVKEMVLFGILQELIGTNQNYSKSLDDKMKELYRLTVEDKEK